jgi:hypothetical protein
VAEQQSLVNNNFGLYVVPIQWATLNPTIENFIDINIYKAGGSDYRFGGLQERRYLFQSNPRADFEKEFPYLHESMTTYLQDRIVFGEEYKSVRDVLHRYQPDLQVQSDTDIAVWPANGNSLFGYKFWTGMYAFWRGSLRYKIISKETEKMKMAYFITSSGNEYLGTTIASSINPVLDISLPYYDNLMFRNTKDLYGPCTLRFSGGKDIYSQESYGYLFRAMGDDFSCHFVVPPKAGSFTGVPATSGLAGFADYLSSFEPPTPPGPLPP